MLSADNEKSLSVMINSLASIEKRLVLLSEAVGHSHLLPVNPDRSYSRQQAAHFLNTSTWTVDRLRKTGALLDAPKLSPRSVRISGDSLCRLLKQRQVAEIEVLKL